MALAVALPLGAGATGPGVGKGHLAISGPCGLSMGRGFRHASRPKTGEGDDAVAAERNEGPDNLAT